MFNHPSTFALKMFERLGQKGKIVATKRKKANGSWEYIIKRSKMLDAPYSFTTNDESHGDAHSARLEAALDAGIIPAEISGTVTHALLGDLIKSYLIDTSMPPSDVSILNVLIGRIGDTTIKSIDYKWVESWVEQMKVELNLSPGTIRHYAGALRRCFDYAGRQNIVTLIVNPIRQLPKRYAQYTNKDQSLTSKFDSDHVARKDEKRTRRLEEGEEDCIRSVMNRDDRPGKERPLSMRYQAALKLMFDLALESAMRMREIYTLTVDQIDIKKKTIFLDKTKNGSTRQVPLTSVAILKIGEYMRHVKGGTENMTGFMFTERRFFPWWCGDDSDVALRALTSKLSAQFSTIFDTAGADGLRFHDLRHEATSRFFERTKLSDFEIMKITGHSSTRMLERYANIRGSHLALRLW